MKFQVAQKQNFELFDEKWGIREKRIFVIFWNFQCRNLQLFISFSLLTQFRKSLIKVRKNEAFVFMRKTGKMNR